jgi:hypothetical protein
MQRAGFVAFVLVLLLATALFDCGSSKSSGVADNCTINSDCNNPLVCAFARCHEECAASRDCPDGDRCVFSGTTGVCQLPQESTCTTTACAGGQVCGTDKQCRAVCTAAGGCAMGDFCLATGSADACYAVTNATDEPALVAAGVISPDGSVLSDASVVGADGAPVVVPPADGSADGSGDGQSTGPTGNQCPSAQTQFGNTASGDPNPYFTSGLGARSATQLFAFSTYVGPDPAGDGGGDNIGAVYVQAFDPDSAASSGPAQVLFVAHNLTTPGQDGAYAMSLYSVALAPTGEIVLVYSIRYYVGGEYDDGTVLYAAFLGTGADAGGVAGLHLQKSLVLETSSVYVHPHAIWSNASQAFILSWWYNSAGYYAKVQKYLVDGRSAGGNDDVVPTDSPTSEVYANTGFDQGAVGASGGLFGVAYISSVANTPFLSVLDAVGTPVGSLVEVAPSGTPTWVTVAGTAKGFVYAYDNPSPSGVAAVFLPTSVDAGVVGGAVDASAFASVNFAGAARAIDGIAIADDMGGVGGVGILLDYPNAVSFAYVGADGGGRQGPNSVFAHAAAAGDDVAMTNLNGSFVVSLYSATNHFTQVAASGCSP